MCCSQDGYNISLHHPNVRTDVSTYGKVFHRQSELISVLGLYVADPVAVRPKAWVCGRWPAGIACSNPTEGIDVCLL